VRSSRQSHLSDRHADHHRVRARHVPRGGVVNTRRPGRRPGRSEAQSIDDAEHGARIKRAMVRSLDLDPQVWSSFRENTEHARTDSWSIRRLHGSGECRHEDVHAGGAFVVHNLCAQDSDMRHDQRWRERPRFRGLGSPSGHGTGVVHAIVGAATATPALAVTAAHSAASMTGSRQLAAIETLAHESRSWCYQG
jgi:hypothetical protein